MGTLNVIISSDARPDYDCYTLSFWTEQGEHFECFVDTGEPQGWERNEEFDIPKEIINRNPPTRDEEE